MGLNAPATLTIYKQAISKIQTSTCRLGKGDKVAHLYPEVSGGYLRNPDRLSVHGQDAA